MDGRIGVGIIGLGGVSRFYLEAAQRVAGLEVAAVCDVRADRLAPFAGRDGLAAYGDAGTLLADPAVDAVVIDTPVRTHVALCRDALLAGRHVCCEKPLALRRSDAQALLALAAARRVTLFTAFHRRYNRGMPPAGRVSVDGLVEVESRYYERIADHADDAGWYATPASQGGGCIVDNGPNAFDVVRHLFGEVTVTHAIATNSPEGVDLDAVVSGRAGGADVVIRLDWAFDGERKDLRARWRDGTELYVDMLAGFPGFKSSLEHEYVGVLEDFAAHVRHRRPDAHGLAATAWVEDVLAMVAKRT